jgi:hypothetical protein
MAETHRPQLSSVFDNMLVRNKKRFDDLYRGGHSRTGERETAAIAVDALGRQRSDAALAAATPGLDPNSPIMRRMRERFGSDWRYEVTERRRVGDEVIVLCKLTLGKDTVRTQFGHAAISQKPLVGASGDLKFKLGLAGGEADEHAALRRAIENGLSNCADLI